MTPFKLNDTPINIPSAWTDLSFGQYLKLKASKTDSELLSVATGLPESVCSRFAPEAIALVNSQLGFLLEEPPEVEVTELLGRSVPKNIGLLEFSRKVNSEAVIKNYQGEEMIGRIVAIYLCPFTDDNKIEDFYHQLGTQPLLSVIFIGKQIIAQLQELRKSEEKIPKAAYEPEEYQAGVKDFEKYGVFGLVRSIALRWHCDMEDVYNWSYNRVLLELKISADENRYQRRLMQIYRRK